MIPNAWYIVLPSSELPADRPLRLRRLGVDLVLWRGAEGLRCLEDRCSHRGAALSLGKVEHDQLECPFHGLRFDHEGCCKLIPANGRGAPVPERFKVRAWPVREAWGWIWLFWNANPPPASTWSELPEPPFFENLRQGWSWEGSTFGDPWAIHYTRAIENQLDVPHLPFVHATTIGRGRATLVHGPGAELKDDTLTFWVKNVKDDGQTQPMRPDELRPEASSVRLQFRFPNFWQNRLSEKMHVFAAFVPIDDSNTIVYIRSFQRFVRVPLLDRLFNYLSMRLNLIILRQDKRVVLTQVPKRSRLQSSEQLIPGDLPIVLYRKRRRELLERAGLEE